VALRSPAAAGTPERAHLVEQLSSCATYDFMLDAGTTLCRVHAAIYGPWHFCSDMKHRFDLAAPYGTCYTGEDDSGAFLEHFPDYVRNALDIPGTEADASRLSTLSVPAQKRLADCTTPKVLGPPLGLTAEIHVSDNRPLTQAWARVFHEAGFDGIRYRLSSDPSQGRIGIALFGTAGEADWPFNDPEPIPDDLLRRVEETWGVHVVP
jgi:hypothetical protein